MVGIKIRWGMILVIFASLYSRSFSQALVPDTSLPPAAKSAINFYSTSFKDQLHLYNGKEYEEYISPFEEGHPYFLQTGFSKGTVNYDGNTYDNVSILYNLVTDQVVILHSNSVLKIQLIKEKVDGFSLSGHSFLHLREDSVVSTNLAAGFYDILSAGKTSLLAKRTKNIQSYTKQKVELKVYEKDHFYLKKENSYFPVRTKKSLLEQFGDKKKEIQQYIKQNKLRFRKDPENTMIKLTQYYNLLTK